jgi:hypothetical protein
MAHEKIEVERFTCDCCGRVVLVDADTPAVGIHGTATEILPAGGSDTVEWFACRPVHIRFAVINAIAEKGWS